MSLPPLEPTPPHLRLVRAENPRPPTLPEAAEWYLHQLRWALRPTPELDRDAVLAEVRGHFVAQNATGAAALARLLEKLGPPHLLARGFVGSWELASSVNRANPLRLLVTLLGRPTSSVVALAAGGSALLLYVCAVMCLMLAVLKPVFPTHVGLFVTGDENFFYGARQDGTSVSGYSDIVVFVGLALLSYVLAHTLMRSAARRLLARQTLRSAAASLEPTPS